MESLVRIVLIFLILDSDFLWQVRAEHSSEPEGDEFYEKWANKFVIASDRCKNEGQTFLSHDPKYFLTCHLTNGRFYEIRLQCKGNEYYDISKDQCKPVPGGGFALYRHVSQICPKDLIGTLKDPNVPQIYHVCLGGHDITASCYGEDVYNDGIKKCINKGELQTLILRDDSKGMIPVPDCKWEGTFAVPFYSKYYYKCTKGKDPLIYQDIYKCEDPTVFNIATESCVERNNSIKFLKLVPAENCQQYYHCVSLTFDDRTFKCSLKHCPSGMMYDKSFLRCVPMNATCESTPRQSKVPRRGVGPTHLLYNSSFGQDHVEVIDEASDHDEGLVKIEAVRIVSAEDNKKDVEVDLLINVPDDGPLLSQLLDLENSGQQAENIIHLMGPVSTDDVKVETQAIRTEPETRGTIGINDFGRSEEDIAGTPTKVNTASTTSIEGSMPTMVNTEKVSDIPSNETLDTSADDDKKGTQTVTKETRTTELRTSTQDPEDNFYEGEVNGENLLLKFINDDQTSKSTTEDEKTSTTIDKVTTIGEENFRMFDKMFRNKSKLRKIMTRRPEINKNFSVRYNDANKIISRLKQVFQLPVDSKPNLDSRRDSVSVEREYNKAMESIRNISKSIPKYNSTNPDEKQSVKNILEYIKNDVLYGMRQDRDSMKEAMHNETDLEKKNELDDMANDLQEKIQDLRINLKDLRKDLAKIPMFLNEPFINKNPNLESYEDMLEKSTRKPRRKLKRFRFQTNSYERKMIDTTTDATVSKKKKKYKKIKLEREVYKKNFNTGQSDYAQEPIVGTEGNARRNRKPKLRFRNGEDRKPQEKSYSEETELWLDILNELIDKWVEDVKSKDGISSEEKEARGNIRIVSPQTHESNKSGILWKDDNTSEESYELDNSASIADLQNVSEQSIDINPELPNSRPDEAKQKRKPVKKLKRKHKTRDKSEYETNETSSAETTEDKKNTKRILNQQQKVKQKYPKSRKTYKEETKRETTLSTPESNDNQIIIKSAEIETTEESKFDLTSLGTRRSNENTKELEYTNRRMDETETDVQERSGFISQENNKEDSHLPIVITNEDINTSSVGKEGNKTKREDAILAPVDIPDEKNLVEERLHGLPELLMTINKAPRQRFHTHHIYYNHPVNEDEHGNKSDEPILIINEDENMTNESHVGETSEENEEVRFFGKVDDNVITEKTLIVKPGGVVEEKFTRIIRRSGGPEKEEGNIEIVEELIDTQYGNQNKDGNV